MKPKFQLDQEELQILEDFERDELKRIPDYEHQIAEYQAAAKRTLQKTRNINIRLAEKDLFKLKAKASEKGLPYQSLVSSLLHQYLTGQIKLSI